MYFFSLFLLSYFVSLINYFYVFSFFISSPDLFISSYLYSSVHFCTVLYIFVHSFACMLEEAVFWHVVQPVVININSLLAITLPMNYLLNYRDYFK